MKLLKIQNVAKKIGIGDDYLEMYGDLKAKIKPTFYSEVKNNKDGKLVLVTAITPTKAGEGKTTTSIALLDGLAKIKQKALLCLREPSMGPVFGLKGGACGGGKVTIEPSEDINLHFTGDMHALTSSINLISAVIDNHIYQGNELNIDPNKVVWNRALDMNDRELREINIGLGSKVNGIQRTDHFEITVASELMAILCISEDASDFRKRIGNILVAYTFDDKPVFLRELRITNAIMKLMRDALKPNIVQTQEGNPCFVHGGPFANIAHGCSSLIATKLALKISPIVITEAGFAADLGAEKFLDITSRVGKLHPDCAVLVATIRALKMHGGVEFEDLGKENISALKEGIKNLEQHYENLRKYNIPVVIAINHFSSDTDVEVKTLEDWCNLMDYKFAFADGFVNGGAGSVELANKVLEALETKKSNYEPIYDVNNSIKKKIEIISKEIYRAKNVVYTEKAEEDIKIIEALGRDKLVVCMAKTPLSFSDNPKLKNTPKDFDITVKEVKLSNGAEFIVALCGNILTMPGLPKIPAAVKMEDEN
jgi:formate--tetrahydrofolate ligase